MSLSKKTKVKVKRCAIDWNEVRLFIEDTRVNLAFYEGVQKRYSKSKNRLSYNALKKYYSTTELVRIAQNVML